MSTPLLLGVLAGAILSGTSLLYATLGEAIVERAGIVNLGLEGILLIGASVGFAVAAATGSAYLGVAAAAAAGGLCNLLFGWLVVIRRANQLASGLAMMFFGIGVSALVGRPFVGAVIAGLPKWRAPWLGTLSWVKSTTLFNYDLLIWLAVPGGRSRLVAPVQDTLGSRRSRGGGEPRRRIRRGPKPRGAPVPGAFLRGPARRGGRCPPVPLTDAHLGRGHDGGPWVHRHRPGDFLQVASAAGHCRRARLRRRRGPAAPAPGPGRRDLSFPAGHVPLPADAPRPPCLGRFPTARSSRGPGQDLLRDGMKDV